MRGKEAGPHPRKEGSRRGGFCKKSGEEESPAEFHEKPPNIGEKGRSSPEKRKDHLLRSVGIFPKQTYTEGQKKKRKEKEREKKTPTMRKKAVA